MKVLIDARRLGNCGIGRYLKGLIRALCETNPENEYYVLYRAGHEAELTHLSSSIIPVSTTIGVYSLEEFFKLPILIGNVGAEVFHSPHYTVPVKIPCASVTTIHDIIHLLFPKYIPEDDKLSAILGENAVVAMDRIFSFLNRDLLNIEIQYLRRSSRIGLCYAYSMIKHAVSISDVIIAVSDAAARDLNGYFVLADKEMIIPNGIDRVFLPSYKGKTISFREKYGIDKAYILSVTRHAPHKNLKELMTMFAKSRLPYEMDSRLVVIGEGLARYPDLEKTVAKLNLSRNIHFIESIPDDDLRKAYMETKFVVISSLYEGFGFPAVEALSLGKPVLSSKGGALKEVCGEGSILVNNEWEFVRNLRELFLNDSLLNELRIRALGGRRIFDWRKAAASTNDAYNRAIAIYKAKHGIGVNANRSIGKLSYL